MQLCRPIQSKTITHARYSSEKTCTISTIYIVILFARWNWESSLIDVKIMQLNSH